MARSKKGVGGEAAAPGNSHRPSEAGSPLAVTEIVLRLPVADKVPGGYVAQHVDASLSGSQGGMLKRLVYGLGQSGARLENGRLVDSGSDAIRAVLERLLAAGPGS